MRIVEKSATFRYRPDCRKETEIMAVSESRKKANLKWDAANLDRVSIAMPKGMKDTAKAAAAAAGESMNQYIIGATEQRISGKNPQNVAEAHGGSNAILAPDTLKIAQEAAQRAGEDIPAFVSRAVTNQDQRDKVAFALKASAREPNAQN